MMAPCSQNMSEVSPPEKNVRESLIFILVLKTESLFCFRFFASGKVFVFFEANVQHLLQCESMNFFLRCNKHLWNVHPNLFSLLFLPTTDYLC